MTRRPPYNLAAALGLQHLIRLHLLVFGIGLFMLGISLQWEPAAWASPIYGILFEWFTPGEWALALALLSFVKLASCLLYPRLVPTALALGSSLFFGWTVSFVAAYLERQFLLDPSAVAVSPLLAMLGAFVVGEHLAVASLLQRERAINGDP